MMRVKSNQHHVNRGDAMNAINNVGDNSGLPSNVVKDVLPEYQRIVDVGGRRIHPFSLFNEVTELLHGQC